MNSLVKRGLNVGQAVVGKDTAMEQFLKRQYRSLRVNINKRYEGAGFVYFWSGSRRANRIGIYLKGGCDLLSIFACEPLIQETLNGTCCIMRGATNASNARSDLLLQTLQDLPKEWTEPAMEKLKLRPNYFKPWFDPTFRVPGVAGPEEFPKSVIVLSIAPDVVRTVYRHKEFGYLVDPGGWWLNQSMDKVLEDLSSVTWFRKNFESIGKLSVEESMANFTKIIQLIRERMEATILVFNPLAVEPGDLTYNYQFVQNPASVRRRAFNLALLELSRKLDFSIVDIDRILKREGVQTQVDFAHWPRERFKPIAQEVFRILQDREIF